MEITKEMTCTITSIIQELGLMPHLKGYHYIRTAIEMILEDTTYLDKITALYSVIGKKYETSGSKVERAIRHCINTATTKGNSRTRAAYAKYVDSSFIDEQVDIHVINSLFLASIVDYITLYHMPKAKVQKSKDNIDYSIELYDESFSCIQIIPYKGNVDISAALESFIKEYMISCINDVINCIIIIDTRNKARKKMMPKDEIKKYTI